MNILVMTAAKDYSLDYEVVESIYDKCDSSYQFYEQLEELKKEEKNDRS